MLAGQFQHALHACDLQLQKSSCHRAPKDVLQNVCLFVCFLLWISLGRSQASLYIVCNKYWEKKVFEGKDLKFQLLGDSNVFHWCHKNNYIKHFHERSLWIFPHKDFITLTRLSCAKIINNKTNRVRRWHQLFVSDQYATSNPNTTCPKANTRASRIFNAVRNMCCAEHVDACLPVLVMEKTLFSCRKDRVLKNRNEDGVVNARFQGKRNKLFNQIIDPGRTDSEGVVKRQRERELVKEEWSKP